VVKRRAVCGWLLRVKGERRRRRKDRLGLSQYDVGLAASPSVELLYRKQTQTTDKTSDDDDEEDTGSDHSDIVTSPRYFTCRSVDSSSNSAL